MEAKLPKGGCWVGESRAEKQHSLWNLPPKSLPKESHTHAPTRAHTNAKPIPQKGHPNLSLFPLFPLFSSLAFLFSLPSSVLHGGTLLRGHMEQELT